MVFLSGMDPVTGLIDADRVAEKGLDLQAQYSSAMPFPHIAIDNFMPPALLENCLDDFPSSHDADRTYRRPQEWLKSAYSPDRLTPRARQLFYSLNSRPFVQIIENISGIKGLIPDPHFKGGGFQEIADGGHLSVHADFNHHAVVNLERRINVLVYLNKDWTDAFGGQLELWDNGMKKCVHSYVPIFNRCVIFNTTSESNHGNPTPVQHPDGISRRSIALYYYTATWDASKRGHTTQFKVRPDSADSLDTKVRFREAAVDLVPPLIYRGAQRLKRELSRRR